MSVVVTGAESFIGKPLRRMLDEKGIENFGIDIVDPISGKGAVADIRADDIAQLFPDGAETLIHLAAISRDPDCRANPKLAYDINIMGTINLLEACKQKGLKQIIFASSEWVYGNVGNDGVQREEDVIDITGMRSEYAISKIAGERILELAGEAAGIAVTVLRFGIVYGPRRENWSAVEALFNAVRTKDEVTVGSLNTARRFIHVEDICSGIAASIGRRGFEIFNLSGDTLNTLEEVVRTSAEILGKNPEIAEKDANAVSIRNPDNAHVKETLSWVPKYTLRQGLEELDQFMKTTESNS